MNRIEKIDKLKKKKKNGSLYKIVNIFKDDFFFTSLTIFFNNSGKVQATNLEYFLFEIFLSLTRLILQLLGRAQTKVISVSIILDRSYINKNFHSFRTSDMILKRTLDH